jgi:NADPH2:quinone reductase
MKAIRANEFGGPEVLKLEDVPDPVAAPGQAVVKLEYAGINFGDTPQFRGTYAFAKVPMTPGSEGAGTVVALGEGVTSLQLGQRVATGGDFGTCAEMIAVNADRLIPLPAGLDTRQAAAVLMQGRTAHYLSRDAYPIQADDKVLIHAGAGGVGSLLIQLAKRAGAYVFTTVSTDVKADFAREQGADHVINYSNEDFAEVVLEATNGEGVQAVFDSVGKTTFEGSLKCTARRGHLVMAGAASGPPPLVDFSQQAMRPRGSVYISTHFGADYRKTPEEQVGRAYDLFRWLQEGELRTHIHREFSLAETADAYREIEDRKTMGKILIKL